MLQAIMKIYCCIKTIQLCIYFFLIFFDNIYFKMAFIIFMIFHQPMPFLENHSGEIVWRAIVNRVFLDTLGHYISVSLIRLKNPKLSAQFCSAKQLHSYYTSNLSLFQVIEIINQPLLHKGCDHVQTIRQI